ncbi:MAG: BlaI/MecI/CopY family transcriptional regulator [Clostridiales bacterium]|jgi:predicted transcriptional regulator|nr:BlaI/MecI/CopY family transcriptional regulator [Clostridiales bacterium]
MEIPKITDGELNILNVLWEGGAMPASDIVKALSLSIGWNRNTTYTFINRLVDKKVVRRSDPGYICEAALTREQVSLSETATFVNKMFKGSLKNMVASFLGGSVSEKEIGEVQEIIAKWAAEKKGGGGDDGE